MLVSPSETAPKSAALGSRRNADRGLSERELVNAALGIVKRSGLNMLTMRRLADELDVTVGAAYKHVEGKDALLRLVIDELYLRVEEASAEESALARVRTILVRFFQLMSEYPGLTGYLATYPDSVGLEHLTATVAGALFEAGFPAPGVERAMRVLFFYTSGALQTPTPIASIENAVPIFIDGLDIVIAGLRAEIARPNGL